MLIVRSPVRISFGGGGTDLPAYYEVYGGAVLSVTINKYFYTVLRRRNDNKIQVISSDLRAVETWQNIAQMSVKGSELEIPLAVLKYLGCDVAVDLFMASEIPPGTGLGSSASVCVNVLKTLAAYLHRPLSNYKLAEDAFHIARHVLAKPVGKQDEYAAAFGGLNYMAFNADGSCRVRRLELAPEVMRELQGSLMLFFTGAAHQSWNILEEQERSTRGHEGVAVESLHEMRRLAGEMEKSLVAGDLYTFAGLLHQGWEAKKRVSGKISNSRIDQLYDVARRSGALGGKITGAGGGGFLLLYCEDGRQASVREALLAEGVREMAFEFDSQGAQVIVNDPFIDGDEKAGSSWNYVPAGVYMDSPSAGSAGRRRSG